MEKKHEMKKEHEKKHEMKKEEHKKEHKGAMHSCKAMKMPAKKK